MERQLNGSAIAAPINQNGIHPRGMVLAQSLASLLSPRAGATPAFQAALFGVVRRKERSRARTDTGRDRVIELYDRLGLMRGVLTSLSLTPAQMTYLHLVLDRWHAKVGRLPDDTALSEVRFCVSLPARDIEDLVLGLKASTITNVRRDLQQRGLIQTHGDRVDFTGLWKVARDIEDRRTIDESELETYLDDRGSEVVLYPAPLGRWSVGLGLSRERRAAGPAYELPAPDIGGVPNSGNLQGIKQDNSSSKGNITGKSVSVSSNIEFEEIREIAPRLVEAVETTGRSWASVSGKSDLIEIIPGVLEKLLPQGSKAAGRRLRSLASIWFEAIKNYGDAALDGLLAALAPTIANPGGFFASFARGRLSQDGRLDLSHNIDRLRQEAEARKAAESAKKLATERANCRAELPKLARRIEVAIEAQLQKLVGSVDNEKRALLSGKLSVDAAINGGINVMISAPNGFKYRDELFRLARAVTEYVSDCGNVVKISNGSGGIPLILSGNP